MSKVHKSKVILMTDYLRADNSSSTCLNSESQRSDSAVRALVYQEDDAYIVAFGEPPYLWRKHASLDEVMQTYFYFDWCNPASGQDIGREVALIGKL